VGGRLGQAVQASKRVRGVHKGRVLRALGGVSGAPGREIWKLHTDLQGETRGS
jgi:hypothetical protein